MASSSVWLMHEFRDDDEGYSAWLSAHPGGYVINMARSHNPVGARLHQAGCRWLTGQISRGVALTGPYVKACADRLDQLAEWPTRQLREQISACNTCLPTPEVASGTSTAPTKVALSNPSPDGRWDIRGPVGGSAVVQAWTDAYIRFERRPPWQEHLRTQIRNRCQLLEPSNEEVLHATFFGDKYANADIENLALYNIDTFRTAGRNGIRFEHGAAVPPTIDGTHYSFCYRYALAPRRSTFSEWQRARKLASFDWITLEKFEGERKLAKVWLALSRALVRGQVEVFGSAEPDSTFALRLELHPPDGRRPVWGGLLKEVFDGAICAFQAHTDTAGQQEVAARLAKYLPADREEIAQLLTDQRWAVVGVVPRLASVYRNGVKWDPADHRCVAGELLPAQPDDYEGDRWAIRGEVAELSR